LEPFDAPEKVIALQGGEDHFTAQSFVPQRKIKGF
jgi:hypothetical protein